MITIPGAGPVRDLFERLLDSYEFCDGKEYTYDSTSGRFSNTGRPCPEHDTCVKRDDNTSQAAESTQAVVEFLADLGIELDR